MAPSATTWNRSERDITTAGVTLLPPHVVHTGRAGTPAGFTKRVLYLEPQVLGPRLVGPAVDAPRVLDPALRAAVARLHRALAEPPASLDAEAGLGEVLRLLRRHLRRPDDIDGLRPGRRLAQRLRDLLDSRMRTGLTLAAAAAELDAHPDHLVRSFSSAYTITPHRYLIARRVDAARGLLLDGMPAAEVAHHVGFYDQPHLTRHFSRQIGTTPARYAASRPRST